MTSISERVAAVQAQIKEAAIRAGRDPSEITLLAASKTQTPESIRQAALAGVECFGENRVQELMDKLPAFEGKTLHFIGRLQRNKVKFVVGRAALIHSVDSLPLLETIERIAAEKNVVQPILLEVNIAGEPSKGGFAPDETQHVAHLTEGYPHIQLKGLMCIPPVAENPWENAEFFEKTRKLYVDIRTGMLHNGTITLLSMGMTNDFPCAIAHGSNLVRVGSGIFGLRPVT